MIIAIDPGITGCIAVLSHSGHLLDFMHMPSIQRGKAKRVNVAAVAAFLAKYVTAKRVLIEQVGAMPGQGVSSMFSFGHSAGAVEGATAALFIPIELVGPVKWKKHFGLTGKDKDAARSMCAQLYPACREFDLKGKGQALADAVLIGRYGLAHD